MTVIRPDLTEAISRVKQKPIEQHIAVLDRLVEQLAPHEEVLAIYGQSKKFWLLTQSHLITADISLLGKIEYRDFPVLGVELTLLRGGIRTRIRLNPIGSPSMSFEVVSTGDSDAAVSFVRYFRLAVNPEIELAAYGDDQQADCAIDSGVLIGSAGSLGLCLGSRYAVGFFPTRMVIMDDVGPLGVWPQSEVIEISVDGPGLVTAGGGAIGGGFGLMGAAEGMLAASVLNSLTTRHSIETYCEIRLKSASLILLCGHASPRELWTHLLPLTHRIATATEDVARRMVQPVPEADLAGNLRELASLHEQGHLNEAEYSAAKGKLLSST